MNSRPAVARARCELHAEREAAARCPSCGLDYCRECVVEHSGRLLCRRCLERPSRELAERGRRHRWWRSARRLGAGAGRVAGWTAGLLSAWLFFYLCGQAIALVARAPASEPPAVPAEVEP